MLKLYNPQEVSEMLGLPYSSVLKILRDNEMPHVKIGQLYKVTENDIEVYLERLRKKQTLERFDAE